jgi:hypothetical protein
VSRSFAAFVELARGVVEDEARAHAEDRWWVLEPTLLLERRDGTIERIDLTGRTLPRADLRDLPAALGARRVACALHVDLLVGAARFPAIVLAAAGPMTAAHAYAAVERTEAGTPRLGPWQVGPDLADEVGAALARPPARR